MTRTEQGYAWWKDDPKHVAAARVQAKAIIAQRHLWHVLVESWAAPVVGWINRRVSK